MKYGVSSCSIQKMIGLLTISFYSQLVLAQMANGGEYVFPGQQIPCVSNKQTEQIISELKYNTAGLKEQGLLPTVLPNAVVKFKWPVKLAASVKDPSFYGISNYVDNNLTYPNNLKDYNCGNRTYDLASGYNHRGIDIYSWPFAQIKKLNNHVEVIAAAPGVIIGKIDNNPDNSCAMCTNCTWNAVYVLNENGSVSWYGHLKTNSLTPKAIGQNVTTGEYLGIMGSSGSSTGPHLHFEVWANQEYTELVDPFAGPCNTLNPGPSWWENQRPYWRTALNKTMSGSNRVFFNTCPNLETTNESNVFAPGQLAYFTNFFQDQTQGMVTEMKLVKPDGVNWQAWNHNSPSTYSSSYWYWSWYLPDISGYWKYVVTIPSTGQVVTHTFYVGNNPPVTSLKPGDFSDPTVWSNNTVPTAGSNIFVCHSIEVKDNQSIGSLVVNESGQLIVATGKTLQVGQVELSKPNARVVD